MRLEKKLTSIVVVDAELDLEPASPTAFASASEAACRGIMIDFRILSGIWLSFESVNAPKLNCTNTLSGLLPVETSRGSLKLS